MAIYNNVTLIVILFAMYIDTLKLADVLEDKVIAYHQIYLPCVLTIYQIDKKVMLLGQWMFTIITMLMA